MTMSWRTRTWTRPSMVRERTGATGGVCRLSLLIVPRPPTGGSAGPSRGIQTSQHYEPVEFDVDELVKFKAAAQREHANDSLARKLLGKKKRRPEKKSGMVSWNLPRRRT